MTPKDGNLTRRTFLAGAGALAASSFATSSWSATVSPALPLGEWLDDDYGLPCYHYTGPLRFPDSPMRDGAAMLPDDPFFLLGNYRLTLFTHASGLVQILTGDRAWGRMNQGDDGWSGANSGVVEFAGKKYDLIGLDSPIAAKATKRFGVGFARFDYVLDPALNVTRVLSVAPSTKEGGGASAFLTQVRLRNTGQQPLELRYSETVRARYHQLLVVLEDSKPVVTWTPESPEQPSTDTVQVSFLAHGKHLLTFAPPGQMTRFEQFPPTLIVKAAGGNAVPLNTNDAAGHPCIGIRCELTLQPGEEHELAFFIGYTRDPSTINSIYEQMGTPSASHDTFGSAYGDAWRRVIPSFPNERDATTRREMRWDAAVLEAMATWREYYDETIIPQGTTYDYIWGVTACSRDLAQQALPFCHTNPAIARSTLRFIMKRTVPDGEIKLNDEGYGWAEGRPQQTSDQQLYFFQLLAEYLRVTSDASILHDSIGYYPLENSGRDTGLAHVRQAFLFLRDRIGVGSHGIVRRWNSDWNDMFFWWTNPKPYNIMWEEGESHMNSAMAIVILGDLATAIDALHDPAAAELTAAMREYRTELRDAFMRDLGDRAFPRRAWTDPKTALGEDNMWLEPQGYTLLIPDLGETRKRRLLTELQRRLLAHETMGARQIENPSSQTDTPPGSDANGGIYYALNGPVILGVATFDQNAAESLRRRMTFASFARNYPDYWTGQWSAADSLDSSLLKTNGLSPHIPYCAHSHAWPLYCYLRLRSPNRAT